MQLLVSGVVLNTSDVIPRTSGLTTDELIIRFREAYVYLNMFDHLIRHHDTYFLNLHVFNEAGLSRGACVPTPFCREIIQSMLAWLTTGTVTNVAHGLFPKDMQLLQASLDNLQRLAPFLESRNLLDLTPVSNPHVPVEAVYRFSRSYY